MTFDELLKASANGLPQVSWNGEYGQVTVIKHSIVTGYKGCAVKFPSKDYDQWFYAESDTDKRKNYMHELSFNPTQP